MKYILLEHADGNDPKILRIFDSTEDRDKETLRAIFGDLEAHQTEEALSMLNGLRESGMLHFEGDPPLQWIDAEVIESKQKG